MARSAIPGHQNISASIIAEMDFDTLAQATVDGWASHASMTLTIVDFDTFKTETGYTGRHPLENTGQTKVLKVAHDGSTATNTAVITDEALTPADISKGISGCFAYFSTDAQAAADVSNLRLFFADASIANYYRHDIATWDINMGGEWVLCGGAIEPGMYDILIGSPVATEIDLVRLTMDTNSVAFTFYITSMFSGAKRKPIFTTEQDDLNASSDEWFADNDTYGFKTAINAISTNIGPTNMTAAVLRANLDNGHFVYSHGTGEHVALGYAATIAQIQAELDYWRAFYPGVVDDTTLMHYALPGGTQLETVREWMKEQGFKTIRKTGQTDYQGIIGQSEYNDSTYHHLPARKLDVLLVADFKTCVDNAIKHGLDYCFYVHDYVTAGERANVQEMLAYLKLKQDNGLCDVMARHQWYEKSIAQYGTRSAT